MGAATEYLRGEYSNNHTAKFLANTEGRKVFLHEIDDDEDYIHISQYEKTEKHKIPILLLEECGEEEFEAGEVEKKTFEVTIPKKIKKFMWAMGALIIVNIFIYNCVSNIGANIVEAQNSVEVGTGTLFDTYTDRIIQLEKKENFELATQKEVREQKQLR